MLMERLIYLHLLFKPLDGQNLVPGIAADAAVLRTASALRRAIGCC